jgi:Na+/H+ antiporter NhaA
MTVLFLVVGLEAKRELDLGELRERSRIAIPVVAGLGGIALATATFVAINAGHPGAHGWGTAVSTDTALALGALALAAPRGSARLRVFLLTLLIIDDLVGLVVIGVAYTEDLSFTALAIAVAFFAVLVSLRWLPRWRTPAAVVCAAGLWVALYESGVDAVIAGLLVGLVTSAYPPSREDLERTTELARSFREQPTPELAYSARSSLTSAISANERLQYRLHPWTSYVIVPLFALANAGVHINGGLLSDAATSRLTLGLLAAYVVAKPIGIVGASWVATRRMLGGARLPITWPGLAGTAAAAGIAFTVSLLVAGLAFHGALLDQAKLGILATAVVSPLVSRGIAALIKRIPAERRARQLGSVAEQLIDLAEDVDLDVDHVRGAVDGPVTLVEYGDYECPYCANAAPIIRELLETCDGLRYVWRHLPLTDVHTTAQMAAEAAEAAAGQGRFWEMHDLLLANSESLFPTDLHAYAESLGLDVERFEDDLRRRRHAGRVRRDVASADASGVAGTPTFFVNGRRHQGAYDVAALQAAVTAARPAAQSLISNR